METPDKTPCKMGMTNPNVFVVRVRVLRVGEVSCVCETRGVYRDRKRENPECMSALDRIKTMLSDTKDKKNNTRVFSTGWRV